MIAVFMLMFLSIHSVHIYAVDPIIEISVNPTSIGTNEKAEIRVGVVNEKPKKPPVISANSDNFSIRYKGSSSQRQVSMIGGTVNSKTTYTYIFELTPNKAGTFDIPTFYIVAKNGNKVFTKSSKITVLDVDTTRPQSIRNQRGNNPFGMMFEAPLETFLQLRTKNDRIGQNTGAIVDLLLFSNDPDFLTSTNNLQQLHRVQFEGGVIHEIPFEENNEITTEQFGHSVFYGKVIRRFLIFPLEKGRLSLRPPAYRYQQRMNVLGDPLEIVSYPITDSLTYIGNMVDINHKLSTQDISVSEELNLSLSIEGDGNVDFFVNPLKDMGLTNIFIAEPETILELGFVDKNSNQLYMRKTFDYTIIPKTAGEIIIPSFTLNFATKNGKSTNTQYPSIKFNVKGSNITPSRDTTLTPKTISKLTVYYGSGTTIMIVSMLLGIVMMLVAFLYSKEQQKLSTDINYARSSGAKKRLQKILQESEQAIQNNNYRDASRLIRQSILYFCADKFSISNSSSPQEIVDFLSDKDFSSQKSFLTLMNDLDFHAFGASPSEGQIKGYLAEAYQLLSEFDKIKFK